MINLENYEWYKNSDAKAIAAFEDFMECLEWDYVEEGFLLRAVKFVDCDTYDDERVRIVNLQSEKVREVEEDE